MRDLLRFGKEMKLFQPYNIIEKNNRLEYNRNM